MSRNVGSDGLGHQEFFADGQIVDLPEASNERPKFVTEGELAEAAGPPVSKSLATAAREADAAVAVMEEKRGKERAQARRGRRGGLIGLPELLRAVMVGVIGGLVISAVILYV